MKHSNKKSGEDYGVVTYGEFRAKVQKPDAYATKDTRPWMIPSSYHASDARESRVQKRAGMFSALVADIDSGNVQPGALEAAVRNFCAGKSFDFILHTTWSSKEGDYRWRVVIPLAEEVRAAVYERAEEVLANHFASVGIVVDESVGKAGKIISFPSARADYKSYWANSVAYLDVSAVVDIDAVVDRVEKPQPETNIPLRLKYNRTHNLEDLFIKYGYIRTRDGWRSPHQTSSSAATRVMGRKWYSLSQSDAKSGLGRLSNSGVGIFGDAYDLYVHFEHGGVKASADEALVLEASAQQIEVSGGKDIFDILTTEIEATETKTAYYSYNGEVAYLSRVNGTLRTVGLNSTAMCGFVNRKFNFVQNKRQVLVKSDVSSAIANCTDLVHSLRELKFVRCSPIVSPDGGVVLDGYDMATREVVDLPESLRDMLVTVPKKPSREMAKHASSLLVDELLKGFHFQTTGSFSNAIAAIFTAAFRGSFGNAPLFAISSSDRGVGKTTLAVMLKRIAGGYSTETGFTRNDEAELNKSLVGIFTGDASAVSFDNVNTPYFRSSLLARLLAGEGVVAQRMLGSNKSVELNPKRLVVATGVKLNFEPDLQRRVLNIFLYNPNPDGSALDDGDFDSNPIDIATNQRDDIIYSCLVIYKAMLAEGFKSRAKFGSFKGWNDICGAAAEYVAYIRGLDLVAPGESVRENLAESDDDRANDAEFVSELYARFGAAPFLAADVVGCCQATEPGAARMIDLLRALWLYKDQQPPNPRVLSRYLRRLTMNPYMAMVDGVDLILTLKIDLDSKNRSRRYVVAAKSVGGLSTTTVQTNSTGPEMEISEFPEDLPESVTTAEPPPSPPPVDAPAPTKTVRARKVVHHNKTSGMLSMEDMTCLGGSGTNDVYIGSESYLSYGSGGTLLSSVGRQDAVFWAFDVPEVKKWLDNYVVTDISQWRGVDFIARALNLPVRRQNAALTYQDLALYFNVDGEQTPYGLREMAKKLSGVWDKDNSRLELDWHIGRYGIRLDQEVVSAAGKYCDRFEEVLDAEMRVITKDAVKKVTQWEQFKQYCAAQKDAYKAVSRQDKEKNDAYWDNLLATFQKRSGCVKTVRKYKAAARSMDKDGVIRHSLRAFSATTGRWAGYGFQPQSLAKATVDVSRDEALKVLRGNTFRQDDIDKVMSYLRPTIIPHEGHKFLISDYSNIEGRIMAYLSGDQDKLQAFKERDVYKWSFERVFGAPCDSDAKRKIGKLMELSLAYGSGGPTFAGRLSASGVDVLPYREHIISSIKKSQINDLLRLVPGVENGVLGDIAVAVVRLWRDSNPKVIQLWSAAEKAMYAALDIDGAVHMVGEHIKVKGVRVGKGPAIAVRLLSGRLIYYHNVDATNLGLTYSRYASGPSKSVRLYGGLLVENFCQAISSDIIAAALSRILAGGHKVAFHCHDEIVAETPEGQDVLVPDLLERYMCDFTHDPGVPWAKPLPLAAETSEGRVYTK